VKKRVCGVAGEGVVEKERPGDGAYIQSLITGLLTIAVTACIPQQIEAPLSILTG
jgi:hypothetical protein